MPTSYAATIEEMCASPKDTIGFIPGLGYVLANQLCGVDVAFKAVRFGSDVYYAQILVARDSAYKTLKDLDGKKWGLHRSRLDLRLPGAAGHVQRSRD